MDDELKTTAWRSGAVGINVWCPECGCGNDLRGYAHLSTCRSSRENFKRFLGHIAEAIEDQDYDGALIMIGEWSK